MKHNNNHYEQEIDQFIDDLNREKKPTIYRSEEAVNPELEELFATVRAVKRLRGDRGSKAARFLGSRWLKGLAAAAAFLLVIGLGVLNLSSPENGNIVHAVIKAYEDLHSYRGVVEIRSESNGQIDFQETIEIQYKKPFMYTAHHRYQGVEVQYISDGQRLLILWPHDQAEVENLFPEREIWRYHIGTTIWELDEAAEVNTLGEEMLLGRETTLLEYRFTGDQEFHQLWIDHETHLPLRKILNHPEERQLIVEFNELEINPELKDEQFQWSDSLLQGMTVREYNAEVNLEEVQAAWPELQKVLDALPDGLTFYRAGALEEQDFYRHVVRFRGTTEGDYLDIYFTDEPREFTYFFESDVGKLADGYVELNPEAWNVFERYIGASQTGRWVTAERDIFLVSSRSTAALQAILEALAGEPVEFLDRSDLIKEGIQPVLEKEGH